MLVRSWESLFCPSVRPSICSSHTCFVTKPNNALWILWHRTKRQSLCFSESNSGWRAMLPSVWNLRSKWPSPLKIAELVWSLCHSWATCKIKERWLTAERKQLWKWPQQKKTSKLSYQRDKLPKTLEWPFKVTQGHPQWCHVIEGVQLLLVMYSNYVSSKMQHFWNNITCMLQLVTLKSPLKFSYNS